jgi:hypothetical protein
MDSILEQAIARRDAAVAESRRWDAFISMYKEINGNRSISSERGMPGMPGLPRHKLEGAGPSGQRGGNTLAVTEKAAVELLREAGQPIPTVELRLLLQDRGIEIGGKDPNSTLSARLSRAPLLYNHRGRGWWIKELADGASVMPDTPSAVVEHQGDTLMKPPAEGREAVPGGGT